MGLRFEVGPSAAVHSPLATQNGFLRFLLRGCDLELFTSVLNGLGPFLEDEDTPVVVPMQIELQDCSVTLKVRRAVLARTLQWQCLPCHPTACEQVKRGGFHCLPVAAGR